MIEKITFNKNSSHSMSYISHLPAIEALGGVVKFKKGLNIIVGPNGAGKSAILRAIGHTLAASQYGESCLSKAYLMGYTTRLENKKDGEKLFNFPFEIVHDAQAVLYGDPKRSTGVSNGDVDKENFTNGLLESMEMTKESSGEQANRRITPFLDVLRGVSNPPEGLGSTFDVDKINDHYISLIKAYVKEHFTAQIPTGQITVLLDEPESSLDMMNQILLWKEILKSPAVAEKFQLIIVSHNMNSLNIEGANYIEVKEGYLKACEDYANGKITIEEAKLFATKLTQKLTLDEKELLKTVATSLVDENHGYLPKDEEMTVSLKKLIDVDFIKSWSYTPPEPKREKGSRGPSSFFGLDNDLTVYTLTAKGSQYLSMHSDK